MANIEVIQVDFYDGTKYIVRTDKKDCHDKLRTLSLEKRTVYEALPIKERKSVMKKALIKIGGLSRRTVKTIDEELYNKIKMKG